MKVYHSPTSPKGIASRLFKIENIGQPPLLTGHTYLNSEDRMIAEKFYFSSISLNQNLQLFNDSSRSLLSIAANAASSLTG
ncbi:hypothetical protein CS542_00830 [Pedobacter sp. IW39]|nr:hypothetical protein CS542_00830 [Pedobacter sp. IW39]